VSDEDLQRLLAGLADESLCVETRLPSAVNSVSGTLAVAQGGAQRRSEAIARGERTVIVTRAGETEWNEQLGATAEQVTRLRNAGATENTR
jgi:hypothetical protein